jgi:hypothetical protein
MSKESLRLDDSVVGHIAKLLQVALITGTDIIDHMRMIRLTGEDSSLVLQKEYQEIFDTSLEKMLENVQTETEDAESGE